MAPRKLGNIDEILELRSRLSSQRWTMTLADTINRLNVLKKLIDSPIGDEAHRHVIVSSIAALQTYHRGTIVTIVDHDNEHRLLAANKITDKVTLKEALTFIEGKKVSFGELVAHTVSVNSTTDLMSSIGNLLNCKMEEELSTVTCPWETRNNKQTPRLMVSDTSKMLSNIAEAFRLRHIFAHEAAPALTVKAKKCYELHASISEWVSAIDALLWATIYKDKPMTTHDMDTHATSKIKKARLELSQVMKIAISDARTAGGASWLRKNHFEWKATMNGWSKNSFGSLEGTLWPSIATLDQVEVIYARIKQIKNWVKWNHPEDFEDLDTSHRKP